ncbi:hypothetical protein PILCRDRAFT_821657 [Piloderma croceum F 1598]|uniref:CHAT domain-containing protein n=1 Tax=Piloderma croceum (strain F 1598) TaxID=765440 RepID=A0A0C3F996_PILCF|nr:hypothetical protein PILCRDRAFT_821657 [Piloderma croceum F 1598]
MLYREALLLYPNPHPKRVIFLSGLASALHARFRCTKDLNNLDEAIFLLREAIEACPESHPYHVDLLISLLVMLLTRYDKAGQHVDLLEGMRKYRDMLQIPNTDSTEIERLLQWVVVVLLLEQSGQRTDLETAIAVLRKFLTISPIYHPNRLTAYSNLAAALTLRFHQSGQHKDLDEAISLLQNALRLQPAPHPDRPSSLNNLAAALTSRFAQSGRLEDLDKAIPLLQEALELQPVSHPDRCDALNNLANALTKRFKQSGQHKDLDTAILLFRDGLQLLPAAHPGCLPFLSNLAEALATRFLQSGQHRDLDEAISLLRDALQLPHPDLSHLQNSLGTILTMRSELSGQREDLDEAISLHRNALQLLPAPHPGRSSSLNNLANALTTRFQQSRQCEDLDEAISLHRDAFQLLSASHHHDQSYNLINLANALRTRFVHSHQHKDLDEAISLHRSALQLLSASHSGRSTSLNNLALALVSRFQQSGQHEDLDEAIPLMRNALQLQHAPHPGRSGSLNNLALALIIQFEQSGQRKDLDESIDLFYKSLDALGSEHPRSCKTSTNLGHTLMTAYSQNQELEYLDKAMAAFRKGATCESAPVSERFHVAKLWARSAHSLHKSALDAYQVAVELLPRLAMLGLDLQARQHALTLGSDGLARDAAACAIQSGEYSKAVELLEEGRAVFWSQALQLRTPMTDLRNIAPKLEEQLRRISLALERGSLRDRSRTLSDTPETLMSIEKEASHFYRLNKEWLTTLNEVRRLDGFQDFLRPNRISTLQDAAVDGPIVILNASKRGCAALILTSTGVQNIVFPDLGFNEVTSLVALLRYAIAQDGRNSLPLESNHACIEDLFQQVPSISDTMQLLGLPLERHVGRASNPSWQSDDIFRCVLGALWEWVAEPVIRLLDLKKCSDPPKLRWCPTGPFAFLPVHAAGIYLAGRTESISDYVVSSYTPTISSLLGNLPASTNSFKMMVIIESQTPGQKPLPSTLDELRKIEAHVPEENLVKLVSGTVNDIVSNLPATSIVHFACHGQQNPHNPLESALLLRDGPLTLSQIMQQRVPNASLAFLSACETAMGDKDLPDEAIHLGATLLFAGFSGVVATMWSIADADGPKIADTFYENIFKKSSSTATDASWPDIVGAARALHLAVAKLRSEGASFTRWVPFIYLGR